MSFSSISQKRQLVPFQQQNVGSNQQNIPLTYFAGTRLIAPHWITDALDEQQYPVTGGGKKGGGGGGKGGKGGSAQTKNIFGTIACAVGWGPLYSLSAFIVNGNYLWGPGTLNFTTDIVDLTGSLLDPTMVANGGYIRFYRGTETQPSNADIPNSPTDKGTAKIVCKWIFFGEGSGTPPNLQVIASRLPQVPTTIVSAVDNIFDDGQINPVASVAEIILDERGGNYPAALFDAPSWLAAAAWCNQDQAHRDFCFCSPLVSDSSALGSLAKELLDPFNGFVRRNSQGLLSCNIYEWGTDPGGLNPLDARYFTKKPSFPMGDWTQVPTEIIVSVTDRAYEYQTNTVIVPNARAQQIRQQDDPQSLDRKHITRLNQGHSQGTETNRRLGLAPTTGTLKVRSPFAAGLVVGAKVKVNTEPEPTGTAEAQLCRVDKIELDHTDEVTLTLMTDNLLPATPYKPTWATPTITVPVSPSLVNFVGIALPVNTWDWPPAFAILATRPDATVVGFDVFLGTSDTSVYDELGTQPAFAARCSLYGGIGTGDTSLKITLSDGDNGPDSGLAANTPGGNTASAADDTLLGIICAPVGGVIPLDTDGDPIMEFVSIVDRETGSGLPAATYYYTVIRGRQGLPARAWAAGASIWIIPRETIAAWRSNELTSLAGTQAFVRLVSYTSLAVDESTTIPRAIINMPAVTAPSYVGADTGNGPLGQGIISPTLVTPKVAVGAVGYNPGFGTANTFRLTGTLNASISGSHSGLSNTVFPLVTFNGWATGSAGFDATRYGNSSPTFICHASGDYSITTGDAYTDIVYSLDGGTTWSNITTWQEISTASVHSYNLGNDFTPTGLSGTGSIVFGIRANADSSTTEILNGQLTVTVINV